MINLNLCFLCGLCVLGVFSQAQAASLPIYPLQGKSGPVYVVFSPDDIGRLRQIMGGAWAHGLNPDQYDAPRDDPDATLRATLKYLSDLSGPRIDLKSIGLRPADWRTPLGVTGAADMLARATNPVEVMLMAGPQSPLYTALQDELVVLAGKIKAGQGGQVITPFDPGNRVLRPGDQHADLPILRTRLGVPLVVGASPTLYDDALARAVMMVQRNHGIKADGVFNAATLALFRQTYHDRMVQVVANLERLRWMPELGDHYILVNIPAATLWAVKGGQVQFDMPVLLGRPDRPTRQFRTDVTGVRLNPTWTAPTTIVRDDILPALQTNPRALKAKGMEVYERDPRGDPDGWTKIDPMGVNWQAVTPDTVDRYRFVQPAGPRNVLGRVRVLMPNPYDIYLHDTDTPDRFDGDDRNVSSGCVRLARPIDIAQFILQDASGWTNDRLAQTLAKPDEGVDVILPQPFPVMFTYQTAWALPDGTVIISDDMYKEDARLYQVLTQAGLVPNLSIQNQ